LFFIFAVFVASGRESGRGRPFFDGPTSLSGGSFGTFDGSSSLFETDLRLFCDSLFEISAS